MRVLIACEESQAVTIELRRLGHEAYSCDIIPCSGGHPEWHLQEDVMIVCMAVVFLLQYSTSLQAFAQNILQRIM